MLKFEIKNSITFPFVLLMAFALNATAGNDRALIKKFKDDRQGVNRTALIIGNSAYKTAPLKNPSNDAADIAKALRALGFDVDLLLDADRMTISKAMTQFGRKLRNRGGAGLFFFAGHGMQVQGRNYLIPVGTEIEAEDEVPFKAVDSGLVLSKMESAGNPLNIVILDACRNNPFARSYRSANTGLAQMDAPKGSLIVYATSPGNVAADGDGRNGLFTKHLLKNMASPDTDVELMMRKVRIGVLDDTGGKQVPWSSSSLQGGFAFNPGKKYKYDVTFDDAPAKTPQTVAKVQTKPDSAGQMWASDYEYGIKTKTSRGNGTYTVVFTAEGSSQSKDIVSRKAQGEKAAMRKIRKLMRAEMSRSPLNLDRDDIDEILDNGELTELEYMDDGKKVVLDYAIYLPAHLAKKIK
ncbi:MAG: caspase family protein [Gammaproteobacteria bacterium]|nr:caspase family protein [Gammaproteobacteria bacterium]